MAKQKKFKTPGPEHTKKALRCLRIKESGKRNYERSDNMLMDLAAELGPGAEIPLNETGKKAIIIDRFDGKKLVWQPCAARRYELKIKEA